MTARQCPSGSVCPSQRCRFYLAGCRCALDVEREHTVVEIAIVLRISESQARRDLESALAKLREELDSDNFSTENATISRPPRRFSVGFGSGDEHAPRVAPPLLSRNSDPVSSDGERAGHLPIPRRWSKKP